MQTCSSGVRANACALQNWAECRLILASAIKQPKPFAQPSGHCTIVGVPFDGQDAHLRLEMDGFIATTSAVLLEVSKHDRN